MNKYKILIHKKSHKDGYEYTFKVVEKENLSLLQKLSDADILDGEYGSLESAKISARKWVKDREKEKENYIKLITFESEY